MSTDELPQNDAELKKALKKLFEDWKDKIDDQELKKKFIVDGAMEGYSKQDLKLKILYIAREAHSGTDDIIDHVERVLSQKKDGDDTGTHPNERMNVDGSTSGRTCWGRALGIAYGLLHGVENWDEIPNIDYFRKTFRTPEGVSFAVMETSKYVNEDTSSKLSKDFEKFAKITNEFNKEEIDLLDPDLIITWNLSYKPGVDFLEKLTIEPYPKRRKLPSKKEYEQACLSPDELVNVWTYYNSSNGRKIPLLDTWHLSAHKESEDKIYTPIVKVAKAECEKVKGVFDEREKKAAKIKDEGPNALPGYSIQKWKILFVDKSYKDKGLEHTKRALSTKKNKLKPKLDVCSKRALRITYGLLHKVEEWDKIPDFNYFRTTFKTPEGISFAAMDASVLKGDAIKEIEIPKPDLIITCNLGDLAKESCGSSHKVFSEATCIGMGTYNGIPLIDAWKIVSKGEKIKESYKSIRKAVKKLISEGKLKDD